MAHNPTHNPHNLHPFHHNLIPSLHRHNLPLHSPILLPLHLQTPAMAPYNLFLLLRKVKPRNNLPHHLSMQILQNARRKHVNLRLHIPRINNNVTIIYNQLLCIFTIVTCFKCCYHLSMGKKEPFLTYTVYGVYRFACFLFTFYSTFVQFVE